MWDRVECVGCSRVILEGGLHTDPQDRHLDILLFDDERSNVVPGLLVVLGVGTITEGKLQETSFKLLIVIKNKCIHSVPDLF